LAKEFEVDDEEVAGKVGKVGNHAKASQYARYMSASEESRVPRNNFPEMQSNGSPDIEGVSTRCEVLCRRDRDQV
jgi:hypothetical protein